MNRALVGDCYWMLESANIGHLNKLLQHFENQLGFWFGITKWYSCLRKL